MLRKGAIVVSDPKEDHFLQSVVSWEKEKWEESPSSQPKGRE